MHSWPRCLPSSTKHWTGRGSSPRPKLLRPGRDRGGSVTSNGGTDGVTHQGAVTSTLVYQALDGSG